MIFEAWRISYQDPEQAAMAAFDLAAERWREQERLRAALTEARRWVGDGDLSDGLAREYWTPEYAAAVDMIDEALEYKVPNAEVTSRPSRAIDKR